MSNTALAPVQRLKMALSMESVKEQFQNALQDQAPLFTASLIDVYGGDTYLQKCEPKDVIMEALKAATLKLPINKSLGFAYIIPYGNKPQFQLGYKGYVQLAMRTGQYRYLNAGIIYTGQTVDTNILTGAVTITGTPQSSKAIGYFAHMETLSGFSKTVYRTVAEVEEHAQRYSKSYSMKSSPWKTNFDEMARKTVLIHLLSKYGILSVEMIPYVEQAETAVVDLEEPEVSLDEKIVELWDSLGVLPEDRYSNLDEIDEESKQGLLASLAKALEDQHKEACFGDDEPIV